MLKAEDICNINVINWMREHYPKEEKLTLHIANERKCSPQQGRLLKRKGVKPGVSDLFIPIPNHGKSGLWVEIKVDNNYPSKEQKEFLENQVKNNFAAACCWENEACKRVIGNYLSDSIVGGYFDQVIYQKDG